MIENLLIISVGKEYDSDYFFLHLLKNFNQNIFRRGKRNLTLINN